MQERVQEQERTGTPRRAVAGSLAGLLIGPALCASVLFGRLPGFLLAAAVLLALEVLGVVGTVRTVRAWAGARGADPGEADEQASWSATPGQRGSAVLAGAALTIIASTIAGYLLVASFGSRDLAGALTGVLVLVVGTLALSACVVPMLMLQTAWRRRPETLRGEAAALAGRLPASARAVRLGRRVAIAGWVATLTVGAVALGTIIVNGAREANEDLRAYSAPGVSEDVRGELGADGYLVADVRCPASVPDALTEHVVDCALTTLGRPAVVRADWRPLGSGTAAVSVREDSARGLAKEADLTGPVPPVSAPPKDIGRVVVERAVRAALVRAGFDVAREPLIAISCPGVGQGYDGPIGCVLGRGYGRRALRVYPDGRTFRFRAGEIADLPHRAAAREPVPDPPPAR